MTTVLNQAEAGSGQATVTTRGDYVRQQGDALYRAQMLLAYLSIEFGDEGMAEKAGKYLVAAQSLRVLRLAADLPEPDLEECERICPDPEGEEWTIRDLVQLYAPDLATAVVVAGTAMPKDVATPMNLAWTCELRLIIDCARAALQRVNGLGLIDEAVRDYATALGKEGR